MGDIRRACASLAVLASFGAGAVGAAPLSQADRSRLAPRIAKLYDSGAAEYEVIVHLHAAPEAALRLAPRGVEQPFARLQVVQETSTQVLGELHQGIAPWDLVVGHVSRLRPHFAAKVTIEGLDALLDHPAVRYVEEDRVWRTTTRQGLEVIHADVAHGLGWTGAGTAVAVIDTGVDYNHLTLGQGPIPNGKVVFGMDTADGDNDPMDCETHGTAVASIVGGTFAVGNWGGGVAPGAAILAYKASDSSDCGSFVVSDVIEAIDDAVLRRDAFNVVAINLSVGGEPVEGPCDSRLSSYAQAIRDATEAGLAVVASSGNDARKTSLASPACVSSSISVASVYDSDDATAQTISYCGNDDCTVILCSDSSLPAGTVTCYSNTNAYLDVFAPSEELFAADAGAGWAAFGGTSGAAPYVSGAVALLGEAFPGITPTEARMLLGITGTPVTDIDNGVTRSLVDVEAALLRSGVGVGQETLVEIPNGTGVPAVSSAFVDSDSEVLGVKVMIKVVHGRPQQLEVVLAAPDGTRVKLHDHAPGTTANPNGVTSFDSLYATYPDDRPSTESLDAFLGMPARGTWTLEVLDTDTSTVPGAAPTLIGWALQLTIRDAPDPSFLVPVAVRSEGASSTFWVTDVRVLNPLPTSSAQLRLLFVPAGSDGTTAAASANLVVPADSVLDLADVVGEVFNVDGQQGNLLFESDVGDLQATSRTYNTGGSAGTYGQFIGMTRPERGVADGDPPLVLLQLVSNEAFRSNIGLSETSGQPATVIVTLYDGASGEPIGSPGEVIVEAFSNAQVNRVFSELGAGSSANAYATVETSSGGGRVVAYASVVDNLTGDAIYVPGVRPELTLSVMVPIVAKVSGQAGTNWVSDLRVYNQGPDEVVLDVNYRPQLGTGGGVLSASTSVAPGAVLAVDDVLFGLYGLGAGSGSLRLVPRGGQAELVATSRTYNQTELGTYGQFIAGVTDGSSGPSTLIHLDKNAAYRTNVGFCEVAGADLELGYTLRGASGESLGTGTVSLDPYQVAQINDIYAAVGAPAADNTRLDVVVLSGNGAYTAYASVVDNLSGDAIYVSGVQ